MFDFTLEWRSCALWVRLGAPWLGSFLLYYAVKGLCVGRDGAIVRRWGVDITLVFPQLCNLSSDLHISSLCFRRVQPLLCASLVSQPSSVYAITFSHWYQ